MTGSIERFAIGFRIPEHWEEYSEADWKRLRNQVELEVGEEEDMDAWDEFCRLQGFADLIPKVETVEDASSARGKKI